MILLCIQQIVQQISNSNLSLNIQSSVNMYKQSLMTNPYLAKSEQNTKMQLSTRLLQYINMYNLKHDEIVYQCPILKTQPLRQDQEDFFMEVQCLQEMNDLQIIYKVQRNREIQRIRAQQKKIDQEQFKKNQAQRKKNQGFFGKLFGSKQKNKGQSQSAGKKLKIQENMMKSSVHLNKINAQLSASKLPIKNSALTATKPSQSVLSNPKPAQNNIKIDANIAPYIKQKDKSQIKQVPQLLSQSISNGNPFATQMQDADIDDLASLKSSNKMVDIKQQDEEHSNQQSQRESKASRVHIQDLQNDPNYKIPRDRLSKRSRNRQQDSDQQVVSLIQDHKNNQQQNPSSFKKPQDAHEPKQNPKQKPKQKQRQQVSADSKKNKSKDKNKDKSGDKNKNKTESPPPHKNNKKSDKIDYTSKKTPEHSPKLKQKQKQKSQQKSDTISLLDSYINSEISRHSRSIKPAQDVSQIIHKDSEIYQSEQYSLLSSADILDSKVIEPKQDSFSDVKIDWLVKLQICQLQQNLLLKRLTNRWNKQFDSVTKLKALRISNITKQIQADSRLAWVRPNFSFGSIVQ